MYVHSDNVLI